MTSLRHWALALFACAMALRLLVAPGLMPAASPQGMQLVMCSGEMQGSGEHAPKQRPACPFVALAAPADLAGMAPASAPPVPPCAVPPTIRAPAAAAVRAPPACHPPATGPPHLA